MRLKYEISNDIYKYDHPLIEKLESGEIEADQFVRMIGPDMPFKTIMDSKEGILKVEVMSEHDINVQRESYVSREISKLKETYGLTFVHMFDEKDTIIKVFPEMKEAYAEINIDEKGCTNCQKTQHAKSLIKKLIDLGSADRDTSQLEGKIPDLAFKKVSGQEIEITEKDIKIPASMMKKPIKLKKEIDIPKSKMKEDMVKAKQKIISINNGKTKIILHNGQAAGDTLMLTAAVKNLMMAHGDKFAVDVRTSNSQLWENNPYITKLDDKAKDVRHIDCRYDGKRRDNGPTEFHYPASVHNSNTGAHHFIHGFTQHLEAELGVSIPVREFKGDIHISDAEKSWMSQVEEMGITNKFWIIINGGKTDFTAKWPNPKHMQAVVDHFKGKITFVQCGASGHGHKHFKLDGAIDLIGKTDLRQLVRLIYHSVGVICPVTFAMHAAAAIECRHKPPTSRPCITIAGGREPVQWEAYPNHQFLHTCGALKKCHDHSTGGCWKSRCQPMGDNDKKDNDRCLYPIEVEKDLLIPKCIDMIKPETIINAIEYHYEGGMLQYDGESK